MITMMELGGGASVGDELHSERHCGSSFAGQMFNLGKKLTLVQFREEN